MATTTTVPAFLDALTSALTTALPGVQVSRAWPGPDVTDEESVFVGDSVDEWTVDIPAIKAGRKPRQESYVVTVEAWVAKPGALRADSAKEAQDRAIALINEIDEFLADNPKLVDSIQHARLTGRGATLVPFGKGWACQATAEITVEARLT